jgi:hypothetical protein
MNIYLDINGVLLSSGTHAANYADEFLQTILEKYPDSTYWLTTYNWNGQNHTKEALAPYLKPETVLLLDHIKPTKWNNLKTDAINFDEDFLWFDDELSPDELKALEEHEAAEQFILVKLNGDPDMLKKLTEVIKANAQHL